MKEITSLQHPLVKHLVKLRDHRRYRIQSGFCVIVGMKMVREVSQSIPLKEVLVTDRALYHEATLVSQAIMKKISGVEAPEGIMAEVLIPQESDLSTKEKIVVLDGVSDPGNMGTLIRTALALGWEGVFITENSCDPFNAKALRSAKGATFRLPFATGSFQDLIELLEAGNFAGWVADMRGNAPGEVDLKKKRALILGNEARGVSEEARRLFQAVSVPMKGEMESLNVAVAGGILMYALGESL